MDQKKIDADIISKSRMHWIDNTKEILSTFMNDSLMASAHLQLFVEKIVQYKEISKEISKFTQDAKNNPLSRERKKAKEKADFYENRIKEFDGEMLTRVKEINQLINRLSQNYIMIRLNFSDNDENNEIMNVVKDIQEPIRLASLKMGWAQYANDQSLKIHLNETRKMKEENYAANELLSILLRSYYKNEWEKVKTGK